MRRFTIVILALVILGIAGTAAVGAAVYQRVRSLGSVEVAIEDHHNRLRFSIPAAIASAVLGAGHVHLDGLSFEARRDLREWAPVALAALDGMEGYDDIPLVEVVDGDERVTIRKKGSKFLVQIEGRREQVRVVVSEETLRRLISMV